MAEEGPSADAERWLAPLRAACDEVGRRVAAMSVAERARPVGTGAGGDTTVYADEVAEQILLQALRPLAKERAGGFTVVTEEAGEVPMGGDAIVVVVDPVDGSVNAKRGLPSFATSIAIAHGRTIGDVWLGLVRDHATGEDIVAERGRGSFVDGARQRPVPVDPPELLMLEGAAPGLVSRAAALLDGRVRRLRACGSLALAICWAGVGRADGVLGLGRGRAVDYAAAQLVAAEAGMPIGLPTDAARAGAPLDTTTGRRVVGARDPALRAILAGLVADPS